MRTLVTSSTFTLLPPCGAGDGRGPEAERSRARAAALCTYVRRRAEEVELVGLGARQSGRGRFGCAGAAYVRERQKHTALGLTLGAEAAVRRKRAGACWRTPRRAGRTGVCGMHAGRVVGWSDWKWRLQRWRPKVRGAPPARMESAGLEAEATATSPRERAVG